MDQREQKRTKRAEYMRRYRRKQLESKSFEEISQRRALHALKMRFLRHTQQQLETEEEANQRRAAEAQRLRDRRQFLQEQETEEEANLRRAAEAQRLRYRRQYLQQQESGEEASQRRAAEAQRLRDLRRRSANRIIATYQHDTQYLPHKCQKCGRGFSKQEYLGKHQKTNCESKTEVLECKPDLPIREITYEQNANWDSSAATTSKSVPYHRTISPTKTDPLATHHEIPKTVIKEEVDADDFDDTYSSQSGDGEQMEYVNCLSDQGELEDPLSEKQHGREGQFTNTAHSQSFPSVLEVADSLAQDIENILNDDLFKFGAVNPIKPRVQPTPVPGMKQEPTLTELKSKCALVELKLRMHYLKTLIQNEEEIGSLKKEACKLQITKEQLEINNMRESHLQKMENLKLEQEFWKLQLKNKIK